MYSPEHMPANPNKGTLSRRAARILLAVVVVLLLIAVYLTQPLWVHRQTPTQTVEATQLRSELLEITAFSPRDFSHSENLDRLAEYIAGEFREASGRVVMQHYFIAQTRYENV